MLAKDTACQYTLFYLAANTEVSEHTSIRNDTVSVLEGRGFLTLSGEEIELEPGVFIFLLANAPHALQAESNLSFLLTLSEKSTDIN